MRFRIIIISVLAVMSMASCRSQYELMLNSNDVDEKYAAAFYYFDEGKYSKAASLFESLTVLTNGTERDDTVRYYWGLSNYRFRDYYTAETNFTQFIEAYPRSPFTSDARYLRIDCLYRSTLRYELDQTPTYTAINAISEYILEFPDTPHMQECKDMLTDLNERLDRKAYEAAKLYYRMEDYRAARVALRNVLKDDAETVYREDVLYYIAMASYNFARMSVPEKQKERYLVFIDDYLNFASELPESHYKKELDVVYRKAQRAIGREVVETDDDVENMTEKDFAKERRRLMREAKKAAKTATAESAE
ncbi:MAG: outer membrane protein assembly factor BamD [Bacteroidales bacterium]|nr:outer membrane protein assembly factor BamD [Bacteroidales bacterium]